jgi:hypothetical protein
VDTRAVLHAVATIKISTSIRIIVNNDNNNIIINVIAIIIIFGDLSYGRFDQFGFSRDCDLTLEY